MKFVAVDYGLARTGLAASDPDGRLAFPLATLRLEDFTDRKAFLADEEAYMKKYGLNEQQAAAIRAKNVLQLIAAGGNAYYLAKFAGIFQLDMQDIGAQQTGMTKDEFKAMLVAAGGD